MEKDLLGLQELHIVSGKAKVVIGKNGKPEYYQKGEQVIIPPGALHWHGTADESVMIHFAINPRDLKNLQAEISRRDTAHELTLQ